MSLAGTGELDDSGVATELYIRFENFYLVGDYESLPFLQVIGLETIEHSKVVEAV